MFAKRECAKRECVQKGSVCKNGLCAKTGCVQKTGEGKKGGVQKRAEGKKEVKKNGGDKMGETTIGVEKKVLTKNVEKKGDKKM